MFAGLPLSFSIIAIIALIIIGLAVLDREPGAGFGCLFAALVLIVVDIGPVCRKSCVDSGRKTLVVSESNVKCKGSKLCDKIEELVELRQTLTAKKSEINKLIKEYSASIKQLETEIRTEKRSKRINSYAQAKDNQRISYDLALIQRKGAYISKLEEILPKLDNGANELEFLQRQTEDDIKMEQVLGDKEIEKLANQIEQTIAKYLPEAGELAISVDESKMESPQQIWQRISGGE
ncbi:MAG: hypothetical protein NTX82_03895 [Candidatus Parcubacteria bacterium]|nr:hypothetical protein [Candidatus Parcubacteria bacterium]